MSINDKIIELADSGQLKAIHFGGNGWDEEAEVIEFTTINGAKIRVDNASDLTEAAWESLRRAYNME